MTDEIWKTRRCADHLGVSTDFILREIGDGRLRAEVYPRPTPKGGIRRLYRIPLNGVFRPYCLAYWPDAAKRLPPPPTVDTGADVPA